MANHENKNQSWNQRFKAAKKYMKESNSTIAEQIGNTPDSVKNATQPNAEFPRWAKLAVIWYERLKEEIDQAKETSSN